MEMEGEDSYLLWGLNVFGCCSHGMVWTLQGTQVFGPVGSLRSQATLWEAVCDCTVLLPLDLSIVWSA